MRYRKLDENGDMNFGNQQQDFYNNVPDAPAQAVWTRLRLWQSEWYLDVTEGTPYQQAALGTGKKETIEPAIRNEILNTEGVTDLQSFTLTNNADERTVSISATVETEYGQTDLTGIL